MQRRHAILTTILVLVTIAAVVASIVLYVGYRNTGSIAGFSSGTSLSEDGPEEVARLVERVGKLIVLPSDQTPVVGTVNDASELARNQQFFLGSQNGDKVLIYPNKAIIYRPDADILINVGPVYLDGEVPQQVQGNDAPPASEPTDTPPPAVPPLTIEVRNGTTAPGRARDIGAALDALESVTVTNVGDAARQDYQNTIVVAPQGVDMARFGSVLTGSVQIIDVLPEGEAPTSASILIILGTT